MTRTGFLTHKEYYPLFVDFHKDVNNRLNKFFAGNSQEKLSLSDGFPAWEVLETASEIVIKAELAGLTESDIQIDANKNILTIRGDKKEDSANSDQTFHFREIAYGKFSRSIQLPFEIDSQKTKAVFKNGVLSITVVKPLDETPKSNVIPISTEA